MKKKLDIDDDKDNDKFLGFEPSIESTMLTFLLINLIFFD